MTPPPGDGLRPDLDTSRAGSPPRGADGNPLAEVSRADVARERAARLTSAEARAVAAEAGWQAAEDRAAVADWLVAVLRSELSGAERRRWWWPWPRRGIARWWAEAEERGRRGGGLGRGHTLLAGRERDR